jgi:hypothetical protein
MNVSAATWRCVGQRDSASAAAVVIRTGLHGDVWGAWAALSRGLDLQRPRPTPVCERERVPAPTWPAVDVR